PGVAVALAEEVALALALDLVERGQGRLARRCRPGQRDGPPDAQVVAQVRVVYRHRARELREHPQQPRVTAARGAEDPDQPVLARADAEALPFDTVTHASGCLPEAPDANRGASVAQQGRDPVVRRQHRRRAAPHRRDLRSGRDRRGDQLLGHRLRAAAPDRIGGSRRVVVAGRQDEVAHAYLAERVARLRGAQRNSGLGRDRVLDRLHETLVALARELLQGGAHVRADIVGAGVQELAREGVDLGAVAGSPRQGPGGWLGAEGQKLAPAALPLAAGDARPDLVQEPLPVVVEALLVLVAAGCRGPRAGPGRGALRLALAPVLAPERDLPAVELVEHAQRPLEQAHLLQRGQGHAHLGSDLEGLDERPQARPRPAARLDRPKRDLGSLPHLARPLRHLHVAELRAPAGRRRVLVQALPDPLDGGAHGGPVVARGLLGQRLKLLAQRDPPRAAAVRGVRVHDDRDHAPVRAPCAELAQKPLACAPRPGHGY